MNTLIWTDDGPLTRPVDRWLQAWLQDEVLPHLAPLTAEEYRNGPAAILHTMARFTYVVDGERVLWAVEWDPGLLLLAFAPDGSLAWTAVPSPNPEFGGRTASQAELDGYDDEAADPGATLVSTGWDAAIDPDGRRGFTPAEPALLARWEAAMAPVQAIGDDLVAELGDDEAKREAWLARCQQSPLWAGSP